MATLNLGRIKPVFRGAYSGSTAYVVDDIVTHGNESFICIQAHGAGTQATSQTAYWTKLAAKGADGTDVGTTITTQGDILYRDGSGLQRLAKPASDKILQNTSGGVLSWIDAPSGKVKQVKTKTANHNFGTISNTNPYHLSQIDITFTALTTDPLLFLSGEVPTDNSSSTNYGTDLGWEVVNNTDSTVVWAYKPSQHLIYAAGSTDKYFPARKTMLWESGSSNHGANQNTSSGFITAGDSITIKTYIRNNDNNMAYFAGNNSGFHVQLAQVWEIK